LDAPPLISAKVFGTGHSAHCGSAQAAPPDRSQTKPAVQDVVASDVQPLPPTLQVWIWVLLVLRHEVVPFVQALMQHTPPLHAPLVHCIVAD
jgi:hypothetical protein